MSTHQKPVSRFTYPSEVLNVLDELPDFGRRDAARFDVQVEALLGEHRTPRLLLPDGNGSGFLCGNGILRRRFSGRAPLFLRRRLVVHHFSILLR